MLLQIFVKFNTGSNLAQAGVRIQISMEYDFIRTLRKKLLISQKRLKLGIGRVYIELL